MDIIKILFLLLLVSCKTTINSNKIEASCGIEGCCFNCYYYPKPKVPNWDVHKPDSLYSKNWVIYFGQFSKKIAAKCVVKNDTNYIYQYDTHNRLILKEVRSKNGNKLECY